MTRKGLQVLEVLLIGLKLRLLSSITLYFTDEVFLYIIYGSTLHSTKIGGGELSTGI